MDEYILLGKWLNSNRLYNPYTKRKIKKGKLTYKKILKKLNKYIKINNKFFYLENRINKICPLSFEKINNGYKVDNIWNSFSGNFKNIKDPFGGLIFDPDYLVHYFYKNRLKYIYTHGNLHSTGFLGDAIGKFPEFYIPGRGNHPEWYLFRLPIHDCYIDDKCVKYVTMGPELTKENIIDIYNLAKVNRTYTSKFNNPLPNIIELYDIYHIIINKCPYKIDSTVLSVMGDDYINQLKMDFYMPYINKLIHL